MLSPTINEVKIILYFGNKHLLIYILLVSFHFLEPTILYSGLQHFCRSLRNLYDMGTGPRVPDGEKILIGLWMQRFVT